VAAAAGPPLPARLAMVVAAERLPLPVPVKTTDLVVEPLTGTIEVRRIGNAKVVAQKMAAAAGQICPEIEAVVTSVVIHCRTKRLDANLVFDRGKTFIEIEELRGLPWRLPADRLSVFYDPVEVGFGEGCPGTLPVGRGECALRDGRTEEAAAMFRQAMASAPQASFAGVRLGDMALARGDLAGALNFYKRASYGDMFGRLAEARVCELDGNCLERGTERLFNATNRPEPVRSELLLRGARVALFADKFAEAGRLVAGAVNARGSGVCAAGGQLLCRRILLVVLEHVTGDDARLALETYLALPDRTEGPLAMPMMRAVAEKAASIGAPLFAANLLAANATSAEGPGLGDYLLRTAELYIAGGDVIRARVVVDYADTRIGRGGFAGSRWAAVRSSVRGANEDAGLSPLSAFELLTTEGVRDVAAAYGAMARARTVQK
jgi:hypothetical protein